MNTKIIILLILMVVGLFFGANFVVDKMRKTPVIDNTNTNTSNQNTNIPSGDDTPEPVVTNMATVDSTSIQDKSIIFLGKADTTISQWQAGLGFYNLTIDFPIDLSLNKSKHTFAYGSESNQDYWFTVSYSEDNNKFIRAILPKEDYLGKNLTPINKDYWKINYIKAFQTAEKFKGSEFRKTNSIASISASLSQSEPKGWLWWIITYTANNGDIISVRINANTGDINDEKGDIIVPATAEQTTPTTTTETK